MRCDWGLWISRLGVTALTQIVTVSQFWQNSCLLHAYRLQSVGIYA